MLDKLRKNVYLIAVRRGLYGFILAHDLLISLSLMMRHTAIWVVREDSNLILVVLERIIPLPAQFRCWFLTTYALYLVKAIFRSSHGRPFLSTHVDCPLSYCFVVLLMWQTSESKNRIVTGSLSKWQGSSQNYMVQTQCQQLNPNFSP